MTKDLKKILDYAIMADETGKNPELKAGYTVETKADPYTNYIENECWRKFVADMKKENPTAFEMYGNGGGKELEERKVGRNIYPPKMASFGSSSRMIYNLMKDVKGFLFEQKLHTTVGGTANLDGFMMTDDKCIFVEAKCREPYSVKSSVVDRKYEDLYRFISQSNKTNLYCEIKDLNDKEENKSKMDVTFKTDWLKIKYFDIKQMICHLLGIATAYLNGEIDGKEVGMREIEFLYLLFNPELIKINMGKDEICDVYSKVCNECQAIDFKALFEVIAEYLVGLKNWNRSHSAFIIIDSFNFKLADQDTCKKFIE